MSVAAGSELGLGGVFAASVTVFSAGGAVDVERTVSHVLHLLQTGCDGVLLFGTTGEANSLSVGERRAVLKALGADARIDASRLMAGTGCCAIPDTLELTRCALDAGVRNVLLLPPFYYKGPSEDGLYNAFASVIAPLVGTGVRVYLYHFPAQAGVGVPDGVTARLFNDYPGTVVGMKDSSADLAHMRGLVERLPGFEVFTGKEAQLLDCLEFGGAGCISAHTNVIHGQAQRVLCAWKARDAVTTAAEQAKLLEMSAAIGGYGAGPTEKVKAILALERGEEAWGHMRPPMTPLQPAQLAELAQRMRASGHQLPEVAMSPDSKKQYADCASAFAPLVEDAMRKLSRCAACAPDAATASVLPDIGSAGGGCAAVVDDRGHLLGVVTDGDVRRSVVSAGPGGLERDVADAMNAEPRVVTRDTPLRDALRLFAGPPRVNTLPVVEASTRRFEGMLLLHDLLEADAAE